MALGEQGDRNNAASSLFSRADDAWLGMGGVRWVCTDFSWNPVLKSIPEEEQLKGKVYNHSSVVPLSGCSMGSEQDGWGWVGKILVLVINQKT